MLLLPLLVRAVGPSCPVTSSRIWSSQRVQAAQARPVRQHALLNRRITPPNTRAFTPPLTEHTATHKGSRRTNDEDRPKQTPRAVHDLVASITHSGPSCATFAQTLVAENGALAARSLYGLLSYIKQYGAAEVERVCSIAVRMGAFRLRFVRRLISSASQPLTDKHPIIEAIATYSSHFHTLSQGELFNDN